MTSPLEDFLNQSVYEIGTNAPYFLSLEIGEALCRRGYGWGKRALPTEYWFPPIKAAVKYNRNNGGPMMVAVKRTYEAHARAGDLGTLSPTEQAALVCTGGKNWGWATATPAMLAAHERHTERIARGDVLAIKQDAAKAERIGLVSGTQPFYLEGRTLREIESGE